MALGKVVRWQLGHCALSAGLFLASGAVFADDVQIFSQDHYSVLCVVAEGVRYDGTRDVERGTAFFLTNDGIAVTNSHVALDEKNYRELHIRGMVRRNPVPPTEELEVRLTVLARDTKLDLALLKADKPIPSQFVHVAKIKTPIPGTGLTIIGCPVGQGPSLNTAKISNVVDDPYGRWLAEGFINPGLSGSPVFNTSGRVIGIATAGIRAGTVDGKPMVIPYPPGIVTPFEFVESGLVATEKVKVSRGDEIESSPLVWNQVVAFSDKFSNKADGDPEKKAAFFKPRQKEFFAASGYEFKDVHIAAQREQNVEILGAPVISKDKRKLSVFYRPTGGMKPYETAMIEANILSAQIKIRPKPLQVHKAFDLYETNLTAGVPAASEKTLTYEPERGYLFSSFKFVSLGKDGASEPRIQLSADRSRLLVTFSLATSAAAGRMNSWLAGTLITSQELAEK